MNNHRAQHVFTTLHRAFEHQKLCSNHVATPENDDDFWRTGTTNWHEIEHEETLSEQPKTPKCPSKRGSTLPHLHHVGEAGNAFPPRFFLIRIEQESRMTAKVTAKRRNCSNCDGIRRNRWNPTIRWPNINRISGHRSLCLCRLGQGMPPVCKEGHSLSQF